jgi:hypothetical protein
MPASNSSMVNGIIWRTSRENLPLLLCDVADALFTFISIPPRKIQLS